MKKEFIDECTDRIFDALMSQKDRSFDSRNDLADKILFLTCGEFTSYEEASDALRYYSSEFTDYWDEHGCIYLESFDPRTSRGAIDIWQGMVWDSCRPMIELITKGPGEEPVALEKETLLSLSGRLDAFYPQEPRRMSYFEKAEGMLAGKKRKAITWNRRL